MLYFRCVVWSTHVLGLNGQKIKLEGDLAAAKAAVEAATKAGKAVTEGAKEAKEGAKAATDAAHLSCRKMERLLELAITGKRPRYIEESKETETEIIAIGTVPTTRRGTCSGRPTHPLSLFFSL